MGAISHYISDQNITLAGIVLYGLVGLVIYFGLPWLYRLMFDKRLKNKKLLAIASAVFFLSLLLPSPLIHGRNTNFVTHFVGGGVFTGLLWLLLKQNLQLRFNWFWELLSLYFLVCGLGVANELFEFLVNGIGLTKIPSYDTWWDLFANTLGAGAFWIIYRLFTSKKI